MNDPLRKTKTVRILCSAAAAALFLFVLVWMPRCFPFRKSECTRTVEETGFSLGFSPLNGSQSETFSLMEGDRIEVSLVRMSGRLSVSIGQAEKTPVYQGNDMELSSFQVSIPEDGDYLLTVTGKRAEGSVSFRILQNNSLEENAA